MGHTWAAPEGICGKGRTRTYGPGLGLCLVKQPDPVERVQALGSNPISLVRSCVTNFPLLSLLHTCKMYTFNPTLQLLLRIRDDIQKACEA